MQKTNLTVSILIAISLLFTSAGVSNAQKEEKALEKVLTSKNLKQIYEIRALKINCISEKYYSADAKGNLSALYDTENISAYDANGNLTENEIIKYDAGAKKYVPVQKWRAVLLADQRPETESLYYYDEKQGGYVESKKWTYEYDERLNLITQTLYDAASNAVIEKNMNKYDGKNNKTENSNYQGQKHVSTTLYKYDENKNELESLKSDPGGQLIEKTTNSYDQAGIKTETAFYKGPNSCIEKKISYNKLACELQIERYQNGTLASTVYNVYDDSGNKTEETEITAAGKCLYLEAFAYDQLNNMIEKARYDSNNQVEFKEVYKYDDLNRRTNEYYYGRKSGPEGGASGLALQKSVTNKFNDLRKIEETTAFDDKQKPLYKNVFYYKYNQ